jgi:carboxymethylenebutenolidase
MKVPGAVAEPDSIETSEITFLGEDGDQIEGYLALAPGEARGGIVVIQEAFGLNEHIRDVARRLANIGYTALAPNLYTREGDPPLDDMKAVFAQVRGMHDSQVQGDLQGAVDHLRGELGLDKVAALGFCAGGRSALILACHGEALDAAIDCWGSGILATTESRPEAPIEMVGELSCPLMAAYGAEDPSATVEEAETLRDALEAAGKDFRIDIYEGAGHAFFADYRENFRPEPAALLWERIVEFLGAKL